MEAMTKEELIKIQEVVFSFGTLENKQEWLQAYKGVNNG